MASEVHASVVLGLSKGHHRTCFRNPRGLKRYYAFYIDDATDTLRYEWSSDGTTWTTAPITVIGTEVYSFDIKIWEDPDNNQLVLSLAVWNPGSGVRIAYKRGRIEDAFNLVFWSLTQDIKNGLDDDLAGLQCIAIARTDNGRMVVAFTEDFTTMGKGYRQTKLIGSDDDSGSPVWSGETVWDDPSVNANNKDKDQVWFGLESYSSSYPNRVLLGVRCPDPVTVAAYSFVTAYPEWDGTAFSNTTQTKRLSADATYDDQGKNFSLLIDEADTAWHIAVQDASGGYRLVYMKHGVQGGFLKLNDIDACTLTLDTNPATDELYAFYHEVAATADFHYKKTPVDMISWGNEQTITFASDMIALTSWNRQIEEGLHIGLEDADTDVWYHEVDVSGAPPPVGQPAIIRTIGIPTGPGARTRPGGWN